MDSKYGAYFKLADKNAMHNLKGLTSQIRRASVSVASNIAEGAGRNSVKEFIRFLGISYASSYKLQSQVLISGKLGLLTDEVAKALLAKIDENQKMNYGLQESLKKGDEG